MSTCLFLKCGGRERISPWYCRVLAVLACPHSRHRSHLSASSDMETLGFLCTRHSGNSLFSPLADIFIHLVKFPPTQTPTHNGYGKNTAKLGIHPWENWNLDHILLRNAGVCYLSGTCQRGNSSGEHTWKCPSSQCSFPYTDKVF